MRTRHQDTDRVSAATDNLGLFTEYVTPVFKSTEQKRIGFLVDFFSLLQSPESRIWNTFFSGSSGREKEKLNTSSNDCTRQSSCARLSSLLLLLCCCSVLRAPEESATRIGWSALEACF